jgi:hypothetical protein
MCVRVRTLVCLCKGCAKIHQALALRKSRSIAVLLLAKIKIHRGSSDCLYLCQHYTWPKERDFSYGGVIVVVSLPQSSLRQA